jgi:hypothetical protein
MCACGMPLHYSDPEKRKIVESLIKMCGVMVTITNSQNGRSWRVPRHFIALHGIKMEEMPHIAIKYAFEEIGRKSIKSQQPETPI